MNKEVLKKMYSATDKVELSEVKIDLFKIEDTIKLYNQGLDELGVFDKANELKQLKANSEKKASEYEKFYQAIK